VIRHIERAEAQAADVEPRPDEVREQYIRPTRVMGWRIRRASVYRAGYSGTKP
jgi:hypothetical protein